MGKKLVLEEDSVIKKNMGISINKIRNSHHLSRSEFAVMMNETITFIEKLERGGVYPSFPFMCRLKKVLGCDLYTILMPDYRINVDYDKIKLINNYNENDQMEILLRTEADKYDISYSECNNIVGCLNNEAAKNRESKLVGYLVKFERLKRKIREEQMAEILGFTKKGYQNFERGGTSIAFWSLNKISNYLSIPIDYFMIGYLPNMEVAIQYLLKDLFENVNNDEEKYRIQYLKVMILRQNINLIK